MIAKDGTIVIGDLNAGTIALLKDVAEASASQAVHETFIAMGLDPKDPITSQENFTALRVVTKKLADGEFQEDFLWLRRTRNRMSGIIGKALLTAVVMGVTAFLTMAWAGLRAALSKIGS